MKIIKYNLIYDITNSKRLKLSSSTAKTPSSTSTSTAKTSSSTTRNKAMKLIDKFVNPFSKEIMNIEEANTLIDKVFNTPGISSEDKNLVLKKNINDSKISETSTKTPKPAFVDGIGKETAKTLVEKEDEPIDDVDTIL